MGLVLQNQLEKLGLTVATPAVQPETTVVNILAFMTFTTDCWGLVGVCARSMTSITGEALVRSKKGVAGKFFVIELPEVPAIGRVAAMATLSERAFVMIVLLMTTYTVCVGTGKLVTDMAVLTGHHIVKADQREIGEMVIEAINDAPAIGDMAGSAYLHIGVLVDVIRRVAGGAVSRQIVL